MIAVQDAWKAGLFRREHWLPNVVSGVIVGVVALPLAFAIALTTLLPPFALKWLCRRYGGDGPLPD